MSRRKTRTPSVSRPSRRRGRLQQLLLDFGETQKAAAVLTFGQERLDLGTGVGHGWSGQEESAAPALAAAHVVLACQNCRFVERAGVAAMACDRIGAGVHDPRLVVHLGLATDSTIKSLKHHDLTSILRDRSTGLFEPSPTPTCACTWPAPQ